MQLSVQNIYSNEEKTQIINLFTSEFPGDKQLLNSKINHIINLHPNLTSIICKNTNNEIVSTMFILESTAEFKFEKLRVCSLSFFATKPEFRRGEASKLVRDYVLDHVLPQFELIIGFPRHVMQGYWGKFGFTETTNSSGIKFNFTELIHENKSNYSWQPASFEDIPEIMNLYQQAVCRKQLKYLRSFETWSYLLKFSQLAMFRILVCREKNAKILSYAVIQGGTIIEISNMGDNGNFILNKNFLINSGFNEIFLSLRGMLSGEYYTLIQFFSEELLTSLLIAEDKWDFMLHSNNQILHDYIFKIESGFDFSAKFIFEKEYTNLVSTFSFMDINLL
jgi:hypothetical protein